MGQFEYVSDLIPATADDLARLDELLFDLDTHANHTYGLIVDHEYRSTDYDYFDEGTLPPFEIRAWHQEFAGEVIICEINEGASVQSIDEEGEEGEYLSTTDITDVSEHIIAVQALRLKVEAWESILPQREAVWLGQFLDLVQDPQEAAVSAYELLSTAPYPKEIAVLSSFRKDISKNGISYHRTVANDAYQRVREDRKAKTELIFSQEIDNTITRIYNYKQNAEGERSLEITDGTDLILEKGVLTSGKVSRLCTALKELLILEFGPAKIPGYRW